MLILANQKTLNKPLTNQKLRYKTGCRGKVVYNAGPGAGGDRQELAVAVPGSGLPCAPCVQCQVKTWGLMVTITYCNMGPMDEKLNFPYLIFLELTWMMLQVCTRQ